MKTSQGTWGCRCPNWKSATFAALASIFGHPVFGAYHLWDINEVYSSADGSVQFIELRTTSIGQQNLLSGGCSLRSTNSTGMSTFTFPSNLPTYSGAKTCIIGTANLSSIPGGVAPNYIIPANFIRPPDNGQNAAIVFVPPPFSSVAGVFATLPADGDSALIRSGASMVVVPTNSPRNFSDQSNTIVPVKFLSNQKLDTNFVATYRTATGVNGSAGPAYTVEYKDALTEPAWSPLGTNSGNGGTKSVTNALSSGTSRLFRLRVR